MYKVIAVDLGGTKIRAGIVDQNGNIDNKIKIDTLANEGREAVLGRIHQIIRDQIKHGADAIALAIPGPVNLASKKIITCPNLQGWDGLSFGELGLTEFGLSVVIENDAKVALFGEAWHGAAKGYQNIILLTLGTGVGGAVMQGGKILHNEESVADELGHIIIDETGPACNAGHKGCLEGFWRSRDHQDAILAQAIIKLADQYQPEIFLIGGGNGDEKIVAIKSELAKINQSNIKLELTKFGSWSGVLGCGKMGLDKIDDA